MSLHVHVIALGRILLVGLAAVLSHAIRVQASQPNREGVRGSSSEVVLEELLRKPINELLGVDEAAATTLKKIGINSIFDLGTSNVFASARAVVELGQAGTPSSRYPLAPGDLVIEEVREEPLEKIRTMSLDKLRLLSPDMAAEIESSLNVTTIRDFANWPPQHAAQELVASFLGSTSKAEALEGEELRPRFGEFPTERVYYTTMALLQMEGDPTKELIGPVSLDDAVETEGFTRPAIGALLTYSQSWYAHGVTLGHMLHSLALAPGEATRIAVIDWSRQTSAVASEVVEEAEQLDNTTLHSRALSEVQDAVSSDFQAGGSRSSSSASSMTTATAESRSGGVLGAIGGGKSGSKTTESAETSALAESSGWSLGNRSVLATLTQNVNDRTEQHATSVRNRRASAVREVSQSEHEAVSTRIVANYNHMHALTVQYYEVVQIYRVEAKLDRADRVLFLPMQLLDFKPDDPEEGMKKVERFRSALIRAALNSRVRSLVADDTTAITLTPAAKVRVAILHPGLVKLPAKPVGSGIIGVLGPGVVSPIGIPLGALPADVAPAQPVTPPPVSVKTWDANAIAVTANLIGRSILRLGSDALHVPDETELLAVSFENINIRSLKLEAVNTVDSVERTVPTDSARVDMDPSVPVRLIELHSIHVAKGEDAPRSGIMVLHCNYLGRRFSLPGIPLELGQGTAVQKVVTLSSDRADRHKELLRHLQDNRAYYNRAIFETLDAATLTMLFSGYRWKGKPLIDQVEPDPIGVAGNFLLLRSPVSADEASGVGELSWQDLLIERGIENQKADTRSIPIPTNGVFAEAVLGRSNSAEKLDITRFWNWQDSPIPIQPPEIAPVATGTRATPEDLKPGQLSSPVLNIVNPTSLPEPSGLGSVLAALANLNFRDMSGLAGTQGLASEGMSETMEGATEAGKLASANMAIEAQKVAAVAGVIGEVAKAAITGGASTAADAATGKGKDNNISAEGARINHGRDMDKRGVKSDVPGGNENEKPIENDDGGDVEDGTPDSGDGVSPDDGEMPNEVLAVREGQPLWAANGWISGMMSVPAPIAAGGSATAKGLPAAKPILAERARELWQNTVVKESFERYHKKGWWFSLNGSLKHAKSKPVKVSREYWNEIARNQRQVLIDMLPDDENEDWTGGEIPDEKLTDALIVKLQAQWARWPDGYFAIYYGMENAHTCNLFVGDTMHREAISLVDPSNRHYFSEKAIYEGRVPGLVRVKSPDDVEPGDIWLPGDWHTEVVVKVDKANKKFRTRGGHDYNSGEESKDKALTTQNYRFYRAR